MFRQIVLMAGAAAAAGCGTRAAQASACDPMQCGVALVIEAHNAKNYGSPEFADDLSPIIKWYIAKGAELPAEERSEEMALALMEQFEADSPKRKKIAKACAREALTDPLYHRILPQLETAIPRIV